MSKFSFASATGLVVAGIAASVYGIADEHMKPLAIGLVLILSAGVFATLTLGTRRLTRQRPDH